MHSHFNLILRQQHQPSVNFPALPSTPLLLSFPAVMHTPLVLNPTGNQRDNFGVESRNPPQRKEKSNGTMFLFLTLGAIRLGTMVSALKAKSTISDVLVSESTQNKINLD
jgi:hypothetical protein